MNISRESFLMLLDCVERDLREWVKESQLKDSFTQTYGEEVTSRLWERIDLMRASGIIH